MTPGDKTWSKAAEELAELRTMWPADVPRELTDPWPGDGLNDYLQRWSKERAGVTAIHFYGTDISYAELENSVGAFAGWLRGRGVGPGDRVGVFLGNCPQLTIAMLGILRIGAVYVPVNPMFKARELAYELADAGVALLLTHPSLAKVVDAARLVPPEDLAGAALPSVMPVLEVALTSLGDMIRGEASPPPPFTIDRAAHSASPSDWPAIMASVPVPPIACDRDALAALNYTGGTTGMPKGCEHTQGHMVYTAISTLLGQGRQPGALSPRTGKVHVSLGFLPMFWIAGEDMAMLNPLIDGSTVVMMTRWDAATALTLIEQQRVTWVAAQADNYVELLELPQFSQADTSSLEACVAISFVRKLDVELRREWHAATGVLLHEASYGMTETHTADTFTHGLHAGNQDLAATPTYCGYPVPGTSIVVVDDDLSPVPVGIPGQILVKSPSVLRGYYMKPEATSASLIDGWLLTGDTGEFDARGGLSYLARSKEMIKVNGMSVFPTEVETLMKSHPSIARIAVAPRDDASSGQRPVAFVELAQSQRVSPAELKLWAKDHMASYKVPDIVIVDTMPMTATGKIRKVELMKGISAQ
ncbi:fatty-acyl-CoA synthase/long-chain acyl-CoA synthetase [Leucobacter komagatae]|uniref:Fatty-acyl-CoA synthase/long-chain acyl-CoA synthetase n=1 Tax=Leucobacter komagatae TaxID=55969 RepID=A0A542Y7X3_9MICO|nr:AMP-binding protein [Leucobacter komagatae]TQL44200.1 fatty-acyl-CoA synthase/long-chain acyl-CoA synthetase [Leucobacter komagatae]